MCLMRLTMGSANLVLLAWLAGGLPSASAQSVGTQQTGKPETGYAVKKPVFGGSCQLCPWGTMGEVVKAALKPYGLGCPDLLQLRWGAARGAAGLQKGDSNSPAKSFIP